MRPALEPLTMTSLPPPSGRPATMLPRPDPWGEQRRRDAAHRARRRRKFLRWMLGLMVVAVIAAVGAVVWFGLWPFGADDSSTSSTEPAQTAATSTTVAITSTTSTIPPTPPERLVEVSEVWLLDRGDDVYDWGVNVIVPDDGPTRSDVMVTIRLLAAGGDTVESIERRLDGVNALTASTAAGRIVEPDVPPVRLEFDITVGVRSDDLALDTLLGTRAVERVDDELTGRIRSSATNEITDVSIVLVWRGDDGEVAAVVVNDVERLRPGVDAQFRIDLEDQRAPDGLPDDVFWSPSS